MNQDNMKKLAQIAGVALGAYFLYRVFSKKQSVSSAVKQTVEKPLKIMKDTADTVVKAGKRLVKGSSEAKAHMAKLRSMQKGKKKKSTSHKGHKTKRGLAQDQKRKSKEKHEKDYRKSKK